MSSFKTFNGYEVEDANARKSVGELGKIAPAIGMVEGTGVTITDSAEGVAIDFEVNGRSTQNGTPTPDSPIAIKSVADSGWFDRELMQGAYAGATGAWGSTNTYVCNKNIIPCKANDKIKLEYEETTSQLMILFYDSNKNFISFVQTQSSNVLETTVIADACYFNFNIANPNGITPTTAKPITVTINDKYALIVDSVGKNELNNTATTQTINGVTFKVNEDKTITVNGTATETVSFVLNSNMLFDVESYILNGCPSGGSSSTYKLDVLDTKGSILAVDSGNGVSFDVTSAFTSQGVRIVVYGGVTANNLKFYPMLRLASVTDATYEPHKESRKYIPISAPLRGIGEVTDVASLSEREVDRKLIERVFDGSDDESWTISGGFAIITVSDAISTNSTYGELICSHFRYEGQSADIGTCFNYNQRFHFAITQSTLDEWLTWLQSNHITLIYELAEPTTESIKPIDVDTFEGVTQISVSDNASCKVLYYRNNEDGKKMRELDNRMVTAEDTINNLESNAVAVAGDIEDIKTSLSENPLLVTLAPSDELPTIVAGSNVGTFKDTWLNRVINDYEYLIIVIRHRNGTKQIVQIPSMLLEIGGTYTFPFNDVQNNINGAYITLNSATRYGIGIFGTLPHDISFELYKYGRPISVG